MEEEKKRKKKKITELTAESPSICEGGLRGKKEEKKMVEEVSEGGLRGK